MARYGKGTGGFLMLAGGALVLLAAPATAAVRVAQTDFRKGESVVVFTATGDDKTTAINLAGSMNGWNRLDSRLTRVAPDSNEWVTTKTLEDGTYQYKFIFNGDQWRQDTDNPLKNPDGHEGFNSVLRLGPGEDLGPSTAKRGDGSIETAALLHRPARIDYMNEMVQPDGKNGYTSTVVARLRTRANDVSKVRLVLLKPDSAGTQDAGPGLAMHQELQDERFAWWTVAVPLPANGQPIVYRFDLDDTPQAGAEAPKPASPDRAGPKFSLMANFVPGRLAQTMDYRPFAWHSGTSTLFATPQWTRDAVFYQIMPERFRNGFADNDPTGTLKWTGKWSTPTPEEKTSGTYPAIFERRYGGDLQGVKAKLDYIQSIGANAIYFNPVFEATSLHKYDATDYRHIDQAFGAGGRDYPETAAREDLLDPKTWIFSASDQVFLDLLKEAKKRNIRVIVDGVFNHVGKSHPAFQDLLIHGKNSRFANWFDVTDWNKPWPFEQTPFTYNGWAGFGGLPNFKEEGQKFADPAVRDHLFAVTRRWMDPNGDGNPEDGIDGWRLDVPDEVHSQFWRDWRTVVKSLNPEAVIIGEIWGEPGRWLRGDQFDSVMNYEYHAKPLFDFWAGRSKASDLAHHLRRYAQEVPAQSAQVMMNILDSHDTDRWFSMMENPNRVYDGQNRPQDGVTNYDEGKPGDSAYRRGLAGVTMQFALPGAPNIWYGTELGMWGADDPHGRKPMWWEDLPNDDPEERPVVAVRAHYQSMAAIRRSNTVLRRGDLVVLAADDTSRSVVFRRQYQDQVALVVVNGSEKPQSIVVQLEDQEDQAVPGWTLLHAGTRWPNPRANRMAPPVLKPVKNGVTVPLAGSDVAILIRNKK